MLQQNFPKSPCYICKEQIADLRGSFIGSHDYADYLRYLSKKNSLDELIKNEKAIFVNAVTSQYFEQFHDYFKTPQKADFMALSDYIDGLRINAKAHKYRLEKVLEKAPEGKFLFLLTHEECHPEEIENFYCIDLIRINTTEKAIEWTLHLGEKTWLNYQGWLQILEDLFGRKNIG